MGCKGDNPQHTEIAEEMFRKGKAKLAARFRMYQCFGASSCGRLCARLVKGPGITQVHCVDIKTGEKTELYLALEDPDFHWPAGRF